MAPLCSISVVVVAICCSSSFFFPSAGMIVKHFYKCLKATKTRVPFFFGWFSQKVEGVVTSSSSASGRTWWSQLLPVLAQWQTWAVGVKHSGPLENENPKCFAKSQTKESWKKCQSPRASFWQIHVGQLLHCLPISMFYLIQEPPFTNGASAGEESVEWCSAMGSKQDQWWMTAPPEPSGQSPRKFSDVSHRPKSYLQKQHGIDFFVFLYQKYSFHVAETSFHLLLFVHIFNFHIRVSF